MYNKPKYLNSTYFQNRGNLNKDNDEYKIYYCKYPSMVLRSKDGTDLAVVNFKYDFPSHTDIGKNIPRPVELNSNLDNKQRFQILFNKNKQPFVIAITNLCDEIIKFDFLKKDVIIKETDPPENLNEINEIHSFETYEINADQNNNSRRLQIEKKTSPNKHDGITLNEEENTTEKYGDYLYLNVSVKNNADKELKKLFSESIWAITNFISNKQPNIISSYSTIRENNYLSCPTSQLYCDGASNVSCNYIPKSMISYDSFQKVEKYSTQMSFCIDEKADSEDDDNCSDDSIENNDDSFVSSTAPPVSENTIAQSYVAGIKGGEIVKINSNKTGLLYDYEIPTPVAIIGMSVIDNYDFDFTNTSDYISYSFYKDQLLGNKLMEITVYDQDICTFCMTSKPKNVLYPCGHNCFCNDCCGEFKKSQKLLKDGIDCPLCKKNVMFTFVVKQ